MDSERKFTLGWQVGITYETPTVEGNRLPKMLALLDEMATHNMNLLSLMMTSYAHFDPLHDGFCWPVKNPRLECFRDTNCANADRQTEFVSTVIEEAEKRGIAIQLFTNLAIYNPEKIRKSYPKATEQCSRNGESYPWLFCPENEDIWQLENDEIEDLLTLYNHPNVQSIGFERLSFAPGSCYCADCRKAFSKDTGLSLPDYTDDDAVFEQWKNEVITKKLRVLGEKIRVLRPGMEVWLHSSCATGWGHDPRRLTEAKIDCVIPHIAHFETNQEQLNALLDHVGPTDTVLHMCVRNRALKNYPIWAKTPELIAQIGQWIAKYRDDHENLRGILFFNENTVSEENRKAVYRLVNKMKSV